MRRGCSVAEAGVRLSISGAEALISAALIRSGVLPKNAASVARALVAAEADGQRGHGFSRVAAYAAQARSGKIDGLAIPSVERISTACLRVDARNGFAYPAIDLAIDSLADLASETGLAGAAVIRSSHCGQLGAHVEQLAERGLIALMFANTPKAMAPWGGKEKIVGTNPWSVAAPAGSYPPLLVDMANTGVARGKIYLAKNKRLPIPLGWALNSRGEPTTDPQEAIDGIILPMAGHKGYAIAVMVDMLSGVLTGSGFLSGVNSPYRTSEKSNCGHLLVAMNIEAFQPLDQFQKRMEDFIGELKAVPPAQGHDQVCYPGEIEAANDARQRREGLLLAEDTVTSLREIAEKTGLGAALPF